ncbi:MAG: hypothetical protein RH948_14255 [Cyclobacteriaceae bacterium]
MLEGSHNIVLDTCCIFNLINGKTLNEVLLLPLNFYVGQIVYSECTTQPCYELDDLLKSGKIKLLADVPVELFAKFNTKYQLGDGETECLVIGKIHNYVIGSDDKKARSCIIDELGESSLTGSIGLLKELKMKAIMACDKIFDSFTEMQKSGGFLPRISQDYFCESSDKK